MKHAGQSDASPEPEDRLAAMRPRAHAVREEDDLVQACHATPDLDVEKLFAYCDGSLPPDEQAWVERETAASQFCLDQLALAAELTAEGAGDPHQPADRLSWSDRCKEPHTLSSELLESRPSPDPPLSRDDSPTPSPSPTTSPRAASERDCGS